MEPYLLEEMASESIESSLCSESRLSSFSSVPYTSWSSTRISGMMTKGYILCIQIIFFKYLYLTEEKNFKSKNKQLGEYIINLTTLRSNPVHINLKDPDFTMFFNKKNIDHIFMVNSFLKGKAYLLFQFHFSTSIAPHFLSVRWSPQAARNFFPPKYVHQISSVFFNY